VLHVLRLRPATFRSLGPAGLEGFEAWLGGTPPPPGVLSTLALLDPTVPFGSRRRTIASLDDASRVEPRYAGYAEVARALRRSAGR